MGRMKAAREAGRMNRFVRFVRKTVSQEPVYGTDVVSWPTAFEVWAEVEDVLPSKAEANLAGMRIGNRPARVRIRWRSDATGELRIVLPYDNDRLLKVIAGPAELGFRDRLEFMAETYTSEGEAS